MTTHAGNPFLYDKLPYDAIGEYEPVTRMSFVPMVVLVPRKLGIKTLAELTAQLKAEPGKHNRGSKQVDESWPVLSHGRSRGLLREVSESAIPGRGIYVVRGLCEIANE